MLRLSQGHLNLLAQCPPKFARTYMGKTSSLPNPELEDRQTWGKQFHLLMQQRELGLPIESLLAENNELDSSLKALVSAAPELFQANSDSFREAEHVLTLAHGHYLLTVIYDLLVAESDRAQIIDWKTYPLPQDRAKIAHNWQTRLYLYLLAETSEYEPEQISMTYWFVKLPHQPESHTFSYSSGQHQKTAQDLQGLLDKLDSWLHEADGFPCLVNCKTQCPYSEELALAKVNSDRDSLVEQIESIPEVII